MNSFPHPPCLAQLTPATPLPPGQQTLQHFLLQHQTTRAVPLGLLRLFGRRAGIVLDTGHGKDMGGSQEVELSVEVLLSSVIKRCFRNAETLVGIRIMIQGHRTTRIED